MKKKSIILAVSATLAILIIIASIFASTRYSNEHSYMALINRAQEYMATGNYDDALLTFRQAILEDRTREDGYLGLASVYQLRGLPGLAEGVLAQAVGGGVTGERLQTMLTDYSEKRDQQEVPEKGDADRAKGDSDAREGVHVNQGLLNFLSTANYAEYKYNYPNLRTYMDGPSCVVRIDNLRASSVYYGTDGRSVDAATQEPNAGYQPDEVQLDNIGSLLVGRDEISLEQLADINGVTNLRQQGNTVFFNLGSCNVEAICQENGTIAGESGCTLFLPQRQREEDDDESEAAFVTHTLQGCVYDAASGLPVNSVDISFYPGHEVHGEPYHAQTGFDGTYSAIVRDSGEFTAILSKDGYITDTVSLYVTETGTEMYSDFTISEQLSGDAYRFVLTWGGRPTDLDSHLEGYYERSDAVQFKVDFTQMQARDANGNLIAELDIDDTSSYGPETVTLYNTDGFFSYYVHNYSKSTSSDTPISASGAEVRVYQGNSLIRTFQPEDDTDVWWYVCTIDHNVLNPLSESDWIPNFGSGNIG